MRIASIAVAASIAFTTGCGGAGTASVGAVFGRDKETHDLYVREAPPGLAASEAGLLPGDQVVMIDGVYVRDLAVKDLRAKLRGDAGSAIQLTIVRGNEVRHVRVTRSTLRAHRALPPREEKVAE